MLSMYFYRDRVVNAFTGFFCW